jgi:diacylglycerol kinase (ATP)
LVFFPLYRLKNRTQMIGKYYAAAGETQHCDAEAPDCVSPKHKNTKYFMIAPPPKSQTDAKPASDGHMRAATLVSSFRYAFAGLRYLLWTQRNAKIHTAIGLAAAALGAVLGLDRYEWLALILTIAMVLAAEGVNTAVEAAVDLASPDYHHLAKIAKDVGAGTVLLTAITSVIVGLVLFLPHLLPILFALLQLN